MRLGRKRRPDVRLFFATDMHGSTLTFRKFLSAPRFYDADALIMGGDLTGKQVIPVDPAQWDSKVAQLGEKSETQGTYLWRATAEDVARLRDDPAFERSVLNQLSCERLAGWIDRAEEVLAQTGTPCYVIAGNDDPPEMTKLLKEHDGPHMRFCEDRVLSLVDGYTVAGFGWSNPTPWDTPRELEEDEVAERLRELTKDVGDPRRAVLNIHLPPYGVLDECPALDVSVTPPRPVIKGGLPVMSSVGSPSVRTVVRELGPLLALCGHVHEAGGARKLGETLVVNPGSEYGEGVLRGALVDLRDGEVAAHRLTSG